MIYSKKNLEHGYANQILSIDLASDSIRPAPLDPAVRDYFLGGRGLGLYLLYHRIGPSTLATDPENPLILSPGPLGGVPQFPGTAKCMAISLSPLTGIPGVSNFGGHFGAYLKYAGFDALEITGKAGRDVMIVIDGFKAEITIEPAPAVDQVFALEHELIKNFTGRGYDRKDMVFLTTGIGALRTRYGCINSHYYEPTKPVDGTKGLFRVKQAGRTGLGTVMIDKRVRAIVVLADYPTGDNPYGAADWDKARQAGQKLNHVVREVDPKFLKMGSQGSAGLISFMNMDNYQSLPVRNYQAGSDPEAPKICGSHYAEHLFEHRGNDGCFPGCSLRCTKGGWTTLQTGAEKGRKVWVDGPEYETAAGFGSNLGIFQPEFIMEANWHCDDYGFDTITLSVIMAFIMECFQRGYLTRNDAEGLELTFGDDSAALTFIHQVGRHETELARQAAHGMTSVIDWVARRWTERTGGADPRPELAHFAMQTKGLPFSLYRTHRSLSMQGSYAAASDIGAHHAAAWLIKVDLLGAFPDFQSKARALITYPRVRLGNDNLGLCKLPWVDVFNPESNNRANDKYINPASQEIYADFINAMLGTDLTWEQIFERTDRDINLQRVMNAVIFGAQTGAYDWIPDRAIGPTDDALYESEAAYSDADLGRLAGLPLEEIKRMPVAERRSRLMTERKAELTKLIQAYYAERGWTESGIPRPAVLKELGLWEFLKDDTRTRISALATESERN
jgi:aldehyde:ferredoxin oxidoreductase